MTAGMRGETTAEEMTLTPIYLLQVHEPSGIEVDRLLPTADAQGVLQFEAEQSCFLIERDHLRFHHLPDDFLPGVIDQGRPSDVAQDHRMPQEEEVLR